MQNKANFQERQVKTTSFMKKDYENESAFRVEQKQTQSNPISRGGA
jgi:hypothetical protein